MDNIKYNTNLSPLLKQYVEIKDNNQDVILFFRVGDFYEMFFEEAILVSKELDLALTGKECGLDEKAPMCGVPYHSANLYISKLISNGHKVAIVEQVCEPKNSTGIVDRKVVKVITPGTVLYTDALFDYKNNYLFSIYYDANGYGISVVDFSIGSFNISNIKELNTLLDLIAKLLPSEIVVNNLIYMSKLDLDVIKDKYNISITVLDNKYYDESVLNENEYLSKLLKTIDKYDDIKKTNCFYSTIAIYKYIKESQQSEPTHIQKIDYFNLNEYMYMDNATIRNLELLETLNGKEKVGSLINVLDFTKTAMGKRQLRSWLVSPLKEKKYILKRQNAIKSLCDDSYVIDELSDYLYEIYDIERLIARITMKSSNPKDLIQLKNSLFVLPKIKEIISRLKCEYFDELTNCFDILKDIYDLINESISEEAPITLHDGNIIKDNYDETIDKLRKSKIDGKNWLVELETKEREKTNIKNLKIKHSRLYGYLFEISNVYKGEIPNYFIRKQTLVSAERYTTKELDELQNTVLNAEEKLKNIEYEIFLSIIDEIKKNTYRLENMASIISTIDTLNSLANCAIKKKYVCPNINEDGRIQIINGRHPVVEDLKFTDEFVPNDTNLNNDNYIDIITGPNMAGKSTYMRQVALIALLAHIGSFVPCDSANITLLDRIFTRVGASDDLSRGRSTFMVEMSEVANILNNATSKSLVILDEIGRGTSTYDGLAIALAIVEYISENIKSKTLFATHYHELTELEGRVFGVCNYNIAIIEKDDDIIFLRKIVKGFAKKSYGIAVAKLAGVNEKIIKRSNVILKKLIKADTMVNNIENLYVDINQSDSFSNNVNDSDISSANFSDEINKKLDKYNMISDYIKNLNIDDITPLDSMSILSNIKKQINDN